MPGCRTAVSYVCFRPIADISQTCIFCADMTRKAAPPFAAPPSRLEGALIGTVGFIAYLVLASALGEGRGTAAGGILTAFGVTLRICWPLRRQPWFWLTLAVLAALHVCAIALFKWSAAADWTGLTFSPFMAADCVLILVVIYLIYRSIYGPPPQLAEDEPGPRYADVNSD